MWFLYAVIITLLFILFFAAKKALWTAPRNEIALLKNEIQKIKTLHDNEIRQLNNRLNNSDNFCIQTHEFSDIIMQYAWKEIAELCYRSYPFMCKKVGNSLNSDKTQITESIKQRFEAAVIAQYKYQYLLFPKLRSLFDGSKLLSSPNIQLDDISSKQKDLFEVVNLLQSHSAADELIYLKNRISFLESSSSNLSAIPYMAGLMADYKTYGLEHLAKELDWGYDKKRLQKVKSIREIRKDAQVIVEKNKEAQYQLAYLLKLFPSLSDVIDEEFSQLPVITVSEIAEYDVIRDYLSKEEYASLSTMQRNQLALERYKKSHQKSKWQIGRDYELYVGYKYSQKGYEVDYYGSYMGLEDLGRDLIASKNGTILIIQCKYWSSKKEIHENVIYQLYGTLVSYCIENNVNQSHVKGVLITNISLSSMAKKAADYLHIEYVEYFEIKDFPCIKCNIGRGENGEKTKIYHLPFDLQYDSTKIKGPGDFFAATVEEAEAAGFRRAYKWHGN